MIGESAFAYSTKLEDVYYAGEKESWEKIAIGRDNECLTNASIHYNMGKVEDAKIAEKEIYLGINNVKELTIDYTPDYAISKDIVWTTSDEEVAAVENGLVTGVGEGEAVITLTVDGTFVSECKVTVVYASGSCGENLTWIYDGQGNLTIKGEGEMTNYAYIVRVPWIVYAGEITKVTVESGVENITDYAFYKCIKLKEVNLPETVKTIGKQALYSCLSLENIIIPKSVSVIGESAFAYSTKIVAVYYTGSREQWSKIQIGENNESILYTEIYYNIGDEESIKFIAEEFKVGLNKTTEIKVGYIPQSAKNKKLVWASSNKNVATVENGVVTGVSLGKSIITVKTEDGKCRAECVVNVVTPVSGITLNKSEVNVKKGKFVILNATITPEDAYDRKVIWTTSDGEVAKVMGSEVAGVIGGVIVGMSGGQAVITAKTQDGGFIAECVVTVESPVTGIKLDERSIVIGEGKQTTITATVEPVDATNNKVVWKSSNEKVATVKDGTVNAIMAGETIITATTEEGGFVAECKVRVTKTSIPVSSMDLSHTEISVEKGKSTEIIATITPENATNKGVAWKSSDEKVATVENGVVTGVGEGSAVITATTKDGSFSKECNVTVTPSEEEEGMSGSNDRVSWNLYENKLLRVTPKGSKKCNVVVVTQDGKGSSVQSGKYEGSGNVTFLVGDTAEHVKVFVWESFETMIPLSEPIIIR